MGKRVYGFSLMELLITIAVAGVLMAVAVPVYTNNIDKRRLQTACNDVVFNLMEARTAALRLNTTVRAVFNEATPTAWCYGIDDDSTCDCTQAVGASGCDIGGQVREQHASDYPNVIPYNGNGISFTSDVVSFYARDGSVSQAGTIALTSTYWACKVDVSLLGRVRLLKDANGQSMVLIGSISNLTN